MLYFIYVLIMFGYFIDVSTTMIVQPGPVVDFLIANQNVRDPYSIDWNKVTLVSALRAVSIVWYSVKHSDIFAPI